MIIDLIPALLVAKCYSQNWLHITSDACNQDDWHYVCKRFHINAYTTRYITHLVPNATKTALECSQAILYRAAVHKAHV